MQEGIPINRMNNQKNNKKKVKRKNKRKTEADNKEGRDKKQ
jgi:hypothetical protein